MSVEVGRVERILETVAFEAVDRYEERTRERQRLGLAEYTEEWHVHASGAVNANELVSVDVEIEFSMDFFAAPEQRHGDLPTPTFHFGSYQGLVESPTLVATTAAVRAWSTREDGAFVGATVAVGVHLPGDTLEETEFDILFHLSFSGWGAPFDGEGAGEAVDAGEGGD